MKNWVGIARLMQASSSAGDGGSSGSGNGTAPPATQPPVGDSDGDGDDAYEFVAFLLWYIFLVLCCVIPTCCAYRRRRMLNSHHRARHQRGEVQHRIQLQDQSQANLFMLSLLQRRLGGDSPQSQDQLADIRGRMYAEQLKKTTTVSSLQRDELFDLCLGF